MNFDESITALDEFLESIKRREVPRLFPEGAEEATKCPKGYDYFKSKYGVEPRSVAHDHMMWTVVDLNWTWHFAQYLGSMRVLEVMAGVGWLTKALRAHGANIISTDNMSWQKDYAPNFGDPVTEIEPLNAVDAVHAYGSQSDILLMAWSSCAADLQAASLWEPQKPVIYIGERPGGCTGSDRFHAGFFPELQVNIPRYRSNWDALYIGRFDKAEAEKPLDCDDIGYARFPNWSRFERSSFDWTTQVQ